MAEQGERFNQTYLSGFAPWDIGAPQPEFLALADRGELRGKVIDVGCGTGEHTLMAAAQGLDAVGVDVAPEAIRLAREKAARRGLRVRFEVADALDLRGFDGEFDTALDSGVFHVFDDTDRPRYVRSVHRVLREGGRLWLMCFSERQPGDWGPRRVHESELSDAFSDGWRVDSITRSIFRTLVEDAPQVQAWLASFTKAGAGAVEERRS